jgi:hypothetical protein
MSLFVFCPHWSKETPENSCFNQQLNINVYVSNLYKVTILLFLEIKCDLIVSYLLSIQNYILIISKS